MNSWEELRIALQKPERPEGSKTITEITAEMGVPRFRVERMLKKLIESGAWQSVNAGPKGSAVYWPVEVKHGTGRNRA